MSAYHGENHHRAKVKLGVVLAIRESNEKLSVLAQRYGLSISQIGKIRRRESWQWVKS